MFDKALINHLERLSLIRFSDEQAVLNLKEAVRFANQLKLIDTTVIFLKIVKLCLIKISKITVWNYSILH